MVRKVIESVLDLLPVPVAFRIEAAKRAVFPANSYRSFLLSFRKLGRPRQVLNGPFAGMNYIFPCVGGSYLAMITGNYEYELHGAIEQLCRQAPDLLVDIGTAEGYYAVGMARCLPRARVVGYDLNRRARYQ